MRASVLSQCWLSAVKLLLANTLQLLENAILFLEKLEISILTKIAL